MKYQLQNLGYLNPQLAQLPNDMSDGSRQLLLAVGWLIHSQRLFDQIISNQTNPLYQDLFGFVTLKVNMFFVLFPRI